MVSVTGVSYLGNMTASSGIRLSMAKRGKHQSKRNYDQDNR